MEGLGQNFNMGIPFKAYNDFQLNVFTFHRFTTTNDSWEGSFMPFDSQFKKAFSFV